MIKVLDTSIRKPEDGMPGLEPSKGRPLMARMHSPLKNTAQPLTPTERVEAPTISVTPLPSGPVQKKLRQRWHFGIRSRSEPMEVMLEIYRTLKALKMEWKAKKGPDEGAGGPDEDSKKRRRREEEERVKKAQELYFVETRCRMDDVMVRMDLQLYRIDDQNYLVDFRNLGYRSIPKTHHSGGSSSAGASSDSSPTPRQPGAFGEMANTADELRARKPELTATRKKGSEVAKGNEVSSPYLFLECAVRLIVELASPQSGEGA